MKQSIFTILSNTPLTDCVYKMVLSGDTSAITAPGQFVNIQITGKFLRRPISVCDYDGSTLTIVYKVVGKGTEILSRMVPGEKLDILTGLGNGYDLTPAGDSPGRVSRRQRRQAPLPLRNAERRGATPRKQTPPVRNQAPPCSVSHHIPDTRNAPSGLPGAPEPEKLSRKRNQRQGRGGTGMRISSSRPLPATLPSNCQLLSPSYRTYSFRLLPIRPQARRCTASSRPPSGRSAVSSPNSAVASGVGTVAAMKPDVTAVPDERVRNR